MYDIHIYTSQRSLASTRVEGWMPISSHSAEMALRRPSRLSRTTATLFPESGPAQTCRWKQTHCNEYNYFFLIQQSPTLHMVLAKKEQLIYLQRTFHPNLFTLHTKWIWNWKEKKGLNLMHIIYLVRDTHAWYYASHYLG